MNFYAWIVAPLVVVATLTGQARAESPGVEALRDCRMATESRETYLECIKNKADNLSDQLDGTYHALFQAAAGQDAELARTGKPPANNHARLIQSHQMFKEYMEIECARRSEQVLAAALVADAQAMCRIDMLSERLNALGSGGG